MFLLVVVFNVIFVIMIVISINRFVMIKLIVKYKVVYIKKNVCVMLVVIWCYFILIVLRLFYGLGIYYFNKYNGFCFIDNKWELVLRIL